jgi:hypothetical protein
MPGWMQVTLLKSERGLRNRGTRLYICIRCCSLFHRLESAVAIWRDAGVLYTGEIYQEYTLSRLWLGDPYRV